MSSASSARRPRRSPRVSRAVRREGAADSFMPIAESRYEDNRNRPEMSAFGNHLCDPRGQMWRFTGQDPLISKMTFLSTHRSVAEKNSLIRERTYLLYRCRQFRTAAPQRE